MTDVFALNLHASNGGIYGLTAGRQMARASGRFGAAPKEGQAEPRGG